MYTILSTLVGKVLITCTGGVVLYKILQIYANCGVNRTGVPNGCVTHKTQ